MESFASSAPAQGAFPFEFTRQAESQPFVRPVLDAAASKSAKEAGQKLVVANAGEWSADVLGELHLWLRRQKAVGESTMTMEQFRAVAVCKPHSHKAWGALPRMAMGRGFIAPMKHADGSPVMRNAEAVKTHGHPVKVWKIL